MNSPLPPATAAREWREVSAARFQDEILPAAEPAVLRGLARDWPAVRAGLESPRAMANYLKGFDTGAEASTMYGDPSIGGRFFYNDQLTGYNFERRNAPLAATIEQLLTLLDAPAPPAVYAGAVPTAANLPGFMRDNALALIPPHVMARIWIGNRLTVQTHYDMSHNVAVVVAGRRRFTLFPPQQLVNLYTGPFEFTLAGQPISMVRLDAVDHERFPKFRAAWAHARVAELAPGDALFVPYMWWHNVESLDTFNVLVNYWWEDTPPWAGAPIEALLHAIMSVKSLPPEKLAIWRTAFEHYVFQADGDPVAHLSPRQRGIQGQSSPQQADVLRNYLLQALGQRKRP